MRCSRTLLATLMFVLGGFLVTPAMALQQSQGAGDAAPDAQQPQERTAEYDAAQADPNYRFHNGCWWYWQNGSWLMWNGGRWVDQQSQPVQPAYSYAPRRSFSYMPTEEGIPQDTASGLQRSAVAPGNVRYQRVVPSYGLRSAGSKVLGNY